MENGGAGEPPESQPEHQPHSHWPRRQIYFVTIEWLDEPHRPESAERLARIIRHTLEHAHQVAPETPASRFVVRVKYDDVVSEIEGQIEHHHHG